MAGILASQPAYELISAIKKRIGLPVREKCTFRSYTWKKKESEGKGGKLTVCQTTIYKVYLIFTVT